MARRFGAHFGWKAGKAEVASWQNSLSRVRDLVDIAELKDNRITLEYEVPYNQSRIDCLLFGRNEQADDHMCLIELKQWTEVEPTEDEGNYSVRTYTGGAKRVVPHPAQQVKGYHDYMKYFVEEFEKNPPLTLYSCADCHNYSDDVAGVYDSRYKPSLDEFPVYSMNDVAELSDLLKSRLSPDFAALPNIQSKRSCCFTSRRVKLWRKCIAPASVVRRSGLRPVRTICS